MAASEMNAVPGAIPDNRVRFLRGEGGMKAVSTQVKTFAFVLLVASEIL